MDWRGFIAAALHEFAGVLRDDRSARLAAMSGLAVLLGMTLLTVFVARVKSRRHASIAFAENESFSDQDDLGDWGLGDNSYRSAPSSFTGSGRWPIDHVLPRRIWGTVSLALVVAAATWLAGLALAPRIPAFLASPEWHFQPLYIAAHIVAVRLFVHVYTRGFERGIAYLDVPEHLSRTLVRGVLGFPGAFTALVVSMPFVALDFLYLFSDRYERAGGDRVFPIDYLMWGIWSVEWFLNAFIWVVLVGFLVKTWWVIRNHPFRAPIEIVLHDRQYRPFLQMSAQGASIVLAFTIVTVAYIWYTGGELTDYAGLCITAMLLLVGFLPCWLLLKSKVHKAVERETLAMRRRLLRNLELAEADAEALAAAHDSRGSGTSARPLEHRLDAAVTILRISYLEGRHRNLGASEARAVAVRMLAPAATLAWQFAKSQAALVSELQSYLTRLF